MQDFDTSRVTFQETRFIYVEQQVHTAAVTAAVVEQHLFDSSQKGLQICMNI